MNRLNRRVRKQPFQERAPDEAGCKASYWRTLKDLPAQSLRV
jgi:hypothetical protein